MNAWSTVFVGLGVLTSWFIVLVGRYRRKNLEQHDVMLFAGAFTLLILQIICVGLIVLSEKVLQ